MRLPFHGVAMYAVNRVDRCQIANLVAEPASSRTRSICGATARSVLVRHTAARDDEQGAVARAASSCTIAPTMANVDSIKQDIHRIADEIRVRIHLAGMEAKELWSKLEPRVQEFETMIASAADKVSDKLTDEASKVGQGLQDELTKLKSKLSK